MERAFWVSAFLGISRQADWGHLYNRVSPSDPCNAQLSQVLSPKQSWNRRGRGSMPSLAGSFLRPCEAGGTGILPLGQTE